MGNGMRRAVLVLAVTAMLFGATAVPVSADDDEGGDRPIADWYADPRDPIENGLQSNGQNAYWVNNWDGEYWLAGGFAPYGCGMTDEAVKSVTGEIEYEGVILERALPDGRAEVTVKLEVENSPMTVFRTAEMFAWLDACGTPGQLPLPNPIAGEGSDGYWDYELEIGMIIPEPGAVIKHWLSVLFGFVPPPYELTGDFRIEAEGEATFTDDVAGSPEGFEPGETAHITLFHEVTQASETFVISVTADDDDDDDDDDDHDDDDDD